MSKSTSNRPLSPFMLGTHYRFQITSALSILHRITGFGLTLGLIPLTVWLYAAAYDASLFNEMSYLLGSIVGKLCLFCWTLAFYYHLGNGLRHLNWDLGKGFSLAEAAASGWLVVIFSLSLTVFTWAIILQKVGF